MAWSSIVWIGLLLCHLPDICSVSSVLGILFWLSGPVSAFLSAVMPLLPFLGIVTISIWAEENFDQPHLICQTNRSFLRIKASLWDVSNLLFCSKERKWNLQDSGCTQTWDQVAFSDRRSSWTTGLPSPPAQNNHFPFPASFLAVNNNSMFLPASR